MSDSNLILRPLPALPIVVRLATAGDLPFIDALQKKHEKMVGWMPTKQLEEKVARGEVVVAEEVSSPLSVVSSENAERSTGSLLPTTDYKLRTAAQPIGYAIFSDRYFKRDDVGIIYALNVVPSRQRGLVGATLLKAVFERAAYGCRLFCCWCAQDIEANKFWEAMGFVALAFRSGGRARGLRNADFGLRNEIHPESASSNPKSAIRNPKSRPARTHIFWQKRIVAGDTTTPWWFPFQTTGGSIREDRLVLPIPPGVRWDEAMPEVLPSEEDCGLRNADCGLGERKSGNLQSSACNPKSDIRNPKSQGSTPKSTVSNPQPAKPVRVQLSGWQFVSAKVPETTPPPPPEPVKPKREKKPKRKHDAKVSAAARELRDRWLERINAPGASLSGAMLPGTTRAGGKYDVSRTMLPAAKETKEQHLLPAA